eukprot:5277384-Pyramimonas_sp.AAC.1
MIASIAIQQQTVPYLGEDARARQRSLASCGLRLVATLSQQPEVGARTRACVQSRARAFMRAGALAPASSRTRSQ